MSKNVRALVIDGPEKMSVKNYPYPEKIEKGAAVMKMIMSGICGSDKHSYKGEDKRYGGTNKEENVPYPIIIGHENYGIIEELGEGADTELEYYGKKLKRGDRVTMGPVVTCGHCYDCRNLPGFSWCQNAYFNYGNTISSKEPPHLFGGCAEYMYLHPKTFVYKVPDDVADEYACMAEMFSCSWYLDKTKEMFSFAGEGFSAGATVVVQGVGPIGITHLAKARYLGAGKIIALDRSDYRLEMSKKFGADITLNTDKTTEEERIALIKDLTEGRGADIVVEAIGYPDLVNEGIKMLRMGGIYLEVGCYSDTGGTHLNIHEICVKNIRIIGMHSECNNQFDTAMKIMRDTEHVFPWKDLVTHRYSLANGEAAMLKSMDPDSMKVVVMPWMK